MINIIIGILIGVIITIFVVSYTISIVYEKQIKKDILVQELLEENSKYKDFVDKQFNELNRTDWEWLNVRKASYCLYYSLR